MKAAFLLLLVLLPARASDEPLPDPSAWHGFNLTDKCGRDADTQQPFREDDFRMIAGLGFNFVRLPIDYRVWLQKGKDPREMNPAVVAEIDQAIAWGRKYGLHVDLCLWRAPGYGVNRVPDDDPPLWTDPARQELFLGYWRFFAARYRDVPNRELSFNLVNEPGGIPAETYAALARRAAAAIWEVSPDRFLFSDGLSNEATSWRREPVRGLDAEAPQLRQSLHAYDPTWLTNFGVTWRPAPENYGVPPRWPAPLLSGYLGGPGQAEVPEGAFVADLHGFPGGAFRLRVTGARGVGAVLRAEGDGQLLASWPVDPFPSPAGRDYMCPVPAGTRRLTVAAAPGCWVRFGALGFQVPGRAETAIRVTDSARKAPGGPITVDLSDPEPIRTGGWTGSDWLEKTFLAAWLPLGSRSFAGEFGCFNRTPHAAALAWMEDNLRVFRKLGVGYALWEFRGAWGVLDSGRSDVAYEEFEGHKLDRAMVDLLQRYAR